MQIILVSKIKSGGKGSYGRLEPGAGHVNIIGSVQ